MSGMEARRAAVRAQLAALPERDLRLFVDILAVDVEAVELPLARFLAGRAQLHERAGETAEPAVGTPAPVTDLGARRREIQDQEDRATIGALRELNWAGNGLDRGVASLSADARAELHRELARLTAERQGWEETARACVCAPGQCTRSEFRDHQGDSPGCVVCAELDPDQPCYAAVIAGLEAGR